MFIVFINLLLLFSHTKKISNKIWLHHWLELFQSRFSPFYVDLGYFISLIELTSLDIIDITITSTKGATNGDLFFIS